ncbi:HAMP domain-containing sensor histidine kinase [Nonomuraea sp. NPDC050310]|uniref:sensor histidine kinase n=1 Tax=unclassified Nonomuraea TaxID=2593643 RepID=UPI0033FB4BAB
MLRDWSVRGRLTASSACTALIINLVVALLITPLVHLLLTDYLTEQVAKAARRVTYNVERYAAAGELKTLTPTEGIDLIQVVDQRGVIRQASATLAGQPPLTRVLPDDEDGRVDAETCTDRLPDRPCLITVGFRVLVAGQDWMIYAYTHPVPWYIGPAYLLFMGLAILVLALLTAAVASFSVRKALRPVNVIKNELAEITATDLGRRVPRTERQDEFDDLARTINETLDRLETAVVQQRRFASDASHDLRSPVTAMRAQVEEAMLHPEETDWAHTSRALLESIDRLQAIVTDLLTLAKLDSGAPGKEEPVDLAALVESELDRRPERKRIDRHLQPGVMVAGDRLRLARLLTNLLDNAERHAEEEITVEVSRSGGCAVLEVLDDGAGIDPAQREVVFRRFTRLDASRNRDAGGTGLGLPIAREIARSHGGELVIADSWRGARFVLRLPLLP